MHRVEVLALRCFGSEGDEFAVGGIPICTLAERYGTPLYIYDRRVLDEKLRILRGAIPPEFSVCYSVKANPNAAFLRHFVARGCGLEVASSGELLAALSAGCPARNVLFAGPGKTEAELRLALERGIGEIHAESIMEIARISAICHEKGLRARVAVRVNPSEEAQGGAMRMGGKPAPFGIDEECLDDALDRLLEDPNIEFQGIHLFAGTQILDYRILANQYAKGLEIAARVAGRLGKPLKTIDFGGGWGIPYFEQDEELKLDELRTELEAVISPLRKDPLFQGTRLLIEPGRYLVGEAGIYVVCVTDIKVSRGKKFLIVDGGMHHHLAASGNLGQTIKRNYPVGNLNKMKCTGRETVDVVGPLCTPLDVLARGAQLPLAEIGDLIGVFQSGAYARTASPLGFLSHPTPPEVWVDEGRDFLLRRRGTVQDQTLDLKPARFYEKT